MDYKYIDMDTYKRKDHFAYFSSLAYPYVGLTSNVDITDWLGRIKSRGLPFFLSACYCAVRAANRVPAFRQRILEGRIIEFDRCIASYTVALEDGTFCFCTLEEDLPYLDYLEYLAEGARAQEAAVKNPRIDESEDDVFINLSKYYISSLPWVSYTALVQPVPMPADSTPRITWGKYFTQEGKILLPVSVLCHHALVDGAHIAAFYQALDKELAEVPV